MSETKKERAERAKLIPVNVCWAFKENESELYAANARLYDEIKDLATVQKVSYGYGHITYKVVANPYNLSNDHLALIADNGNLCFGYSMGALSTIIVHTD